MAEMLELRRQGYTFADIARKYGADHTTIMFHCQRAGLALNRTQQKEMRGLMQGGHTVEETAALLGVSSTVVTLYCSQHGVPGSDEFPPKGALKRLEEAKGKQHASEKREEKKKELGIQPAFKIDERGVAWRRDGEGEWICMGRSKYFQATAKKKLAKKDLELKRLSMLKY